VTGSLDANSQLCLWSIRGPSIHRWKGSFRVQDCAISPDGKRLVAADTDFKIHVFDLDSREEDYCLSLSSKPTSVTISRDSKHLIVNLAEGEIQLIDLDTTDVVQRFRGHKQGEYVIRSTFGGAGENFVVSGSEGKYRCAQMGTIFG
jgi:WD40 repeat protein